MLQDKVHITITISNLKGEVNNLNSKLEEGMTKSIHMLSFGSETLYEILGVGKTSRVMKGVRVKYDYLNSKTKFVPPIKKIEFIMSNYKSQNPFHHHNQHSNVYDKASWVCHYYG